MELTIPLWKILTAIVVFSVCVAGLIMVFVIGRMIILKHDEEFDEVEIEQIDTYPYDEEIYR